ncbi:MAG: FAD binding domain-containing protein [Xanthomonadales bacterium]|nr:FAD binding domain-containing protein [Xanthomonadales bacterium]MDZ4116047.1 FAD binding domain-containing protein [Xanthomonadaceae bacterium]MDZ4379009.1 FAD binding domain-containing protein [Xanthomonadaceae bacterium]
MNEQPTLTLNGRSESLTGTDPQQSLLRWLKQKRLHGTKEGCADGDCGACTVALVDVRADGSAHYQAINACLLPMGALPGREVVTVEALADGERLHPAQQAMVDCNGSQCGYCTPGFVMSLFVAGHSGETGDAAIEGNLCRCTGYLPIRAAAQRLADAAIPPDRFAAAIAAPRPPLPTVALERYFSPTSVSAALALKAQHPDAVWINGATDLGVNLSRGQTVAPAFIALDRIGELQMIAISDDSVRIGASVPLTRIEQELHGVFRALDDMLPWFAARQVRNRASFGGNLGSASPIGDLLPILLALDARIHLRGVHGERAVAADGFFLDYRKTVRADDELIVAVSLPRTAGQISASYKVAKRQTDDISIVAASFALQRDAQGRVAQLRLAFGGVAATPRRTLAVEDFLRGKPLDAPIVTAACDKLRAVFTPLSDHRASADYRRELCANLFARFVAEHCA